MKVLVPIDDSECSWNAVDLLSKRKWPQAIEFRIVTVVPYWGSTPFGGARKPTKLHRLLNLRGQQIIEDVIKELKNVIAHAEISDKVLIGDITSSIVQEAMDWKPDLIVMGSHGRKGFQKLIFGSIAEDVSQQVNCKVEIVKQIAQPQ